jgi:hypothetical protein
MGIPDSVFQGNALIHVFQAGSRAQWDITASSKLIEELSQTADSELI